MLSPPPFRSDAEIAAIGEGLCDRRLPKAAWTHAAHFAAALWLISNGRDGETPRLIRAYNLAVGGVNSDAEGYHETITQASLAAARAFLADRAGQPLHQVCNDLLASPYGRSDWLLKYWSRERLFSVAARRGWLTPDLAPLPFQTG
jgi:hypothetical protein